MTNGIFISEFQNTFKFLGNIDYIWQRVTDGMVTDEKYFEMLPEVKKVPIRGAVHNYRVHRGWKEQADNFLWAMDDCFQMIAGDYEDSPLTEQSAIDFWCWMNYVAEQTGMPVFYYAGAYNIRDRLNAYNGADTEFGTMDWNGTNLWIARLNSGDEPDLTLQNVPFADTWKFWQYNWEASGSKYGCGSVHVCEDRFNGTVEELEALVEKHGEPPAPCCEELIALVNVCTRGIAELARRIDTLQQGQLELAENGLGYEKRFERITNDFVGRNGIYERIEDLEYKIDGLEGGHNHPRWMRKLGLVKD